MNALASRVVIEGKNRTSVYEKAWDWRNENAFNRRLSRGSRAIFAAVAAAAVAFGCSKAVESEVWFEDVAAQRGITFQHVSGYTDRPYLPEIMGGGVAMVDVEGDGDLDLYFVQSGWHLASSPELSETPTNQLYLNDGSGYFALAPSGDAANTGYGMGVTTGDYDNDGDTDLYVTNVGENVLLQNDGKGMFVDVTEIAGVSDTEWSTAATFSDFDADGDLDLFVVNNIMWSIQKEIDCYSRGLLTYCLPTNYQAPAPDTMFRNNGDGTFTDVTRESGIETAFGNGLGAVTADFDGNGLLDVFVANDTMVNQLWLNDGAWHFTNSAVQWACAVDNHGFAKAGMGVDAVDLDDDADQDVLVVNLEGQSDSVYINQNTYFRDQTSHVGLGAGSRRFTRFGVGLADFNNDTVVDLLEANGKVDGDPRNPIDEFAEPNMLFRGVVNTGLVRFEPLANMDGTATPQVHTSRSLAIGDLDLDGDLDAVIVNRDAAPYLLINTIGANVNWIRFRVLNQHGSDALGATVTLSLGEKQQVRYVKVAGGYLSSHDPHAHFGLDSHTLVRDVRIRWPTGQQQAFGDFDANQVVTLKPATSSSQARPE